MPHATLAELQVAAGFHSQGASAWPILRPPLLAEAFVRLGAIEVRVLTMCGFPLSQLDAREKLGTYCSWCAVAPHRIAFLGLSSEGT